MRAVAVLSVILFHFFPSALPGGYLGVDVFFVISGYLITGIIWTEIEAGRFSVVRFYDRRIRRIMPALLVLLLAATCVAFALLLPSDLTRYGKSLLATLGFVSNIFFWRDTGYFGGAASEKPLLHMWSLGVEEQFYIFFPILLVVVARWWRSGTLLVLTVLTALSFGLNVVVLKAGGDLPAFYLLPTRAWQLGLGAIAALLPAHVAPRSRGADLLAATGVVLIAAGIFYPVRLASSMPVALPLSVGSAFVIFAGRRAHTMVGRALAVSVLVWVGTISYSLYLWHWPTIVYLRYYLVRELTWAEVAVAAIVMLAGATLSWRFVERPFRAPSLEIRTVRRYAGVGVVSLAIVAVATLLLRGLPNRFPAEAAAFNTAAGTNYRCPVWEFVVLGLSRACLMNLPSRKPEEADVVLLGNSHAQMYAPVWNDIFRERGRAGLLIPFNSCLPTVHANTDLTCIDVARRSLEEVLKLRRVRTVILGLTWGEASDFVDPQGRKVDNSDNRALIAALDSLIELLRSAGKTVVLLGPIATPGWDIASVASRQLAFGRSPGQPMYMAAQEFHQRFGAAIAHFEAQEGVVFVRADRILCGEQRCDFLRNGRSMFADGGHVASAELWRFRSIFEAALPR